MHYVDEGPRNGAPILMLHGEPTWSYLYRHMIPVCAAAGHRVLAPDLIGFGKSDKPQRVRDYSYHAHMEWMTAFLKDLNVMDLTLVCQDWGSLIGLRLAAEHPERFRALVVSNGGLPTGDRKAPPAFRAWRLFARYSPWFPISRIVQFGCFKRLIPAERAAYDAPFPNGAFKAGARAFPRLVPTTPDDPATEANRRAWKVLEQWKKPLLTAFTGGDPITRGGDRHLQKHVPGALGQPHVRLRGGHFVQEDAGEEWAKVINGFLAQINGG